jgi:hypothetical protein
MMGTKIRSFSPLPHDLSLEDLVPKDNFYRRLEARLDLSFVRELVGPLYANGGRPSVDPVGSSSSSSNSSCFSRTCAPRGSSCGRSQIASRLGGTWATTSSSRFPTILR